MSSTTSSTSYEITGTIGNSNSQDSFNIVLTTQSGTDDATALAVAQALKGVAYPAGVTCDLSIFKNLQTTDTSSGDLSSTPPSFN